jgi:hypothetical protein
MKDNSCKEFEELKNSNIVDNRSGCIALITRDKESQCIDGVGVILRFCPYCGNKIKSGYDKEKGHWNWWHE